MSCAVLRGLSCRRLTVPPEALPRNAVQASGGTGEVEARSQRGSLVGFWCLAGVGVLGVLSLSTGDSVGGKPDRGLGVLGVYLIRGGPRVGARARMRWDGLRYTLSTDLAVVRVGAFVRGVLRSRNSAQRSARSALRGFLESEREADHCCPCPAKSKPRNEYGPSLQTIDCKPWVTPIRIQYRSPVGTIRPGLHCIAPIRIASRCRFATL